MRFEGSSHRHQQFFSMRLFLSFMQKESNSELIDSNRIRVLPYHTLPSKNQDMPLLSDDEYDTPNNGATKKAKNEKWKRNAVGEVCPKPVPRWTEVEVLQLQKAIDEACARYQISAAEDLFGGGGRKKGHSDLWYEVANEFLHRPVESVYKKACREFQLKSRRSGPWTNEECQQLLELVLRHGTKWAMIAKLLNRTADGCADKYRLCHKNFDLGPWGDADVQKLKNIVAEYENEEVIPWSTISKRMGSRPRTSCYQKWLHLIHKGEVNAPSSIRAATSNSEPSPTTRTTARQASTPKSQETITPQLRRIYASLDDLFVQSDLNTITTKEIMKILEGKFDMSFPEKTRKLIKKRLRQLVTGKITPSSRRRQSRAGNATAAASTGTNPKDIEAAMDHTDTQSTGDSDADEPRQTNSKKIVTSTKEGVDDESEYNREEIDQGTTGTPNTKRTSEVTMQDVSNVVMSLLKDAPERRMKEKSLRHEIETKLHLESKSAKKWMKKLLRSSEQRTLKLDGKMVFMAGAES